MKKNTVLWALPLALLLGGASSVKGMEQTQTSKPSIEALNKLWIETLVPESNLRYEQKFATEKPVLRNVDGTGHLIVTLDSEGRVQVWRVWTGALLKTLSDKYEFVKGIKFSSSGREIEVTTLPQVATLGQEEIQIPEALYRLPIQLVPTRI